MLLEVLWHTTTRGINPKMCFLLQVYFSVLWMGSCQSESETRQLYVSMSMPRKRAIQSVFVFAFVLLLVTQPQQHELWTASCELL